MAPSSSTRFYFLGRRLAGVLAGSPPEAASAFFPLPVSRRRAAPSRPGAERLGETVRDHRSVATKVPKSRPLISFLPRNASVSSRDPPRSHLDRYVGAATDKLQSGLSQRPVSSDPVRNALLPPPAQNSRHELTKISASKRTHRICRRPNATVITFCVNSDVTEAAIYIVVTSLGGVQFTSCARSDFLIVRRDMDKTIMRRS